ncbi:MAG: cytochrome P450 [Sandaracinaceae bacterium]
MTAPSTAPLPPGPPPRRSGLLGLAADALPMMLDPIGVVTGRFARYGDVYYVPPPGSGPGLYVLRHPDHIHQVLVTDARAFRKTHPGLRSLAEVLGAGLLTTDGDTWRRQRRLVQPAFSRDRLHAYATVMGEEATRFARRWSPGQRVDVAAEMAELTLRVVARTLFGHDVGQDAETVRRAMRTVQSALGFDPLPPWLSPQQYRLRAAVRALDRIIYDIVAERRKDVTGRDDLLGMLLAARDVEGDGGGLADQEIRDQLMTLFLAGHETTANGLSWAFWLLSQHPEVEERLAAESRRVLGGRPATARDLPDLPLADQVFKEALRLYPPVYAIPRQSAEDLTIGGWPVEAGSEVVLWVFQVHRDPRFFDEPWAFRPERFAPDAERAIQKGAYVPFGAGPRACIGKVFAQMEGALILATVAARARFRPDPAYRPRLAPRITLTPAGGMPMTVAAPA